MTKMQHQVDIVLRVVDKASSGLNKMSKSVKKMSFDMRNLSLMFGGMAMQRFFAGALRSLSETYREVHGDQSNLVDETVRAQAAFEFLKFTMMDALMQSDMFINLIDLVINIINWVAGWSEQTKVTAVGIVASLALVGGALMILGQSRLFWDAVFSETGFLRLAGKNGLIRKNIGGIKTAIAGIALLKIGWEAKSLATGDQTLREFLDNIDLALLGLGFVFKGKARGYVLVLAVALKLMPFGERIKEAGEAMIDEAGKRVSGGLATAEEGRPVAGHTETTIGLLEGLTGFIITGIGTALETGDVLVERYDTIAKQNKQLVEDVGTKTLPALEEPVKRVDEMMSRAESAYDLFHLEQTPQFVSDSQLRVEELEKEEEVMDRLLAKKSSYLTGGEGFSYWSLDDESTTEGTGG